MCHDGTDLDALIAEFELKPKFIYRALGGFAAPMDEATAKKLRAHECVECVDEDAPVSLLGWPQQTNTAGLVRMGVDRFPIARINSVPKAPIDVDVAVIDSGIDPHPDLNVYTNVSIVSADISDEIGHGTLVAGVLAAKDNGFGIVGTAPGVRLWSLKAASPENALWSNFTAAFGYVLQHSNRISVVNASFVNAGVGPVASIRLGIQRLVNAGIVVVAAAGNNSRDIAGEDGVYGTSDDVVPASLPLVMAVSSSDPVTDALAAHSNFSQIERTNNAYPGLSNYVFSPGGAIDVAAPGTNILTTAPAVDVGTHGSYTVVWGTSLSAPFVSGLVALYIAANGRATNAAGVYRIRQAIIDASLPQSQWNTSNTMDPDTNPEPLAMASEAWVPKPAITNYRALPGAFQLGFATVPGYNYTVRATTNVTSPIPWEEGRIGGVSGGSNLAPAVVTDTNASPQRFYQLARKSALEVPPLLLSQSQDLRVPAGSNAAFSARVTGLAPLGYQWHKGGAPLADGETLSGANTAWLTLSNVQPSDAGAYFAIITNEFGSVTSVVATLTVLANPASAPVSGVVASATSELMFASRYASNTVNGTINQNGYWESVGVGPYGMDREPALTFDLGSVRALERVEIWNGPEPATAVRRLIVAVSTDAVTFHPLDEFTLAALTPASETLLLGGAVARYVRFIIQENVAGQIFPVGYAPWDGTGALVQLDEVEFREFLFN